jgi:hypothetical protein
MCLKIMTNYSKSAKQKFSNIKNKTTQKLYKKNKMIAMFWYNNNMIPMCFDITESDLLSKYKLK